MGTQAGRYLVETRELGVHAPLKLWFTLAGQYVSSVLQHVTPESKA
jgi:hypothetical protein